MSLADPDLLAHIAIMRREAVRAMGEKAFPRYGEISSYNPDTFQAKVLVYPELHESGWLNIGTKFVGPGWGLLCAPSIGDMVIVHFADGDYNAGLIGDSFFTNVMVPPGGIQSGEVYLAHQSGSFLKLSNSGNVDITANADLNVTVKGNIVASVNGNAEISTTSGQITMSAPTINLDGDVAISGNITAGSAGTNSTATINGSLSTTGDVSDSKGSMAEIRTIYDGHDHDDPQGGTTSSPNQQM